MSGVLNAIIARGFGPEVARLGTAYSDARNAQNATDKNLQVQDSNLQSQEVNRRSAEINQQATQQEMAQNQQAQQQAQAQQAQLQQFQQDIAPIDAALRANPDDQQARMAAVDVATRYGMIDPKQAANIQSIFGLNPKGNASQARPVMVMGPNGQPVYADSASAVGQQAYVKPNAPQAAPAQMKPPTGYAFTPEGTLAAIPGGPADPTIAQPETPAEKAAKVKVAVTDRQNAKALKTYKVGMTALAGTLDSKLMGPIIGRTPAYTVGQQKMEGAIAGVVPLLKSLFRSSGEGVFTDRDQQLLTDMAPKRTDDLEAALFKIDNINNIVASKLGTAPNAGPSGPQAGGTSNEVNFEDLPE